MSQFYNNPDEGHGHRVSEAITLQRRYLKQYFIHTGTVSFQMDMMYSKICIVDLKRWTGDIVKKIILWQC